MQARFVLGSWIDLLHKLQRRDVFRGESVRGMCAGDVLRRRLDRVLRVHESDWRFDLRRQRDQCYQLCRRLDSHTRWRTTSNCSSCSVGQFSAAGSSSQCVDAWTQCDVVSVCVQNQVHFQRDRLCPLLIWDPYGGWCLCAVPCWFVFWASRFGPTPFRVLLCANQGPFTQFVGRGTSVNCPFSCRAGAAVPSSSIALRVSPTPMASSLPWARLWDLVGRWSVRVCVCWVHFAGYYG